MSSAAPISVPNFRRHRDPPILWQAVLIGSLVLHLAVLLTLRRFQVEIVATKPAVEPVPVELIDQSALAGNDSTAPTTTLTTPSQPALPQTVANPASAPATVESAIAPPSPKPLDANQPPRPSPTAAPPKTTPPKQPQAPTQARGNLPAPAPLKPTPPNDGFGRVIVKSNPAPAPLPGGAPLEPDLNGQPAGSNQALSPTKAIVNIGITQQQPTPQTKLEAGGELTLKFEPLPPLEFNLFAGLQPGTGQELTVLVLLAIDHRTGQAIFETVRVLPQSPAVQKEQMKPEDLDSLVKKALQKAQFEVTNNSIAVQKAKFSEWEMTMVFKVS